MSVTIYHADSVVNLYAKTGSDYAALARRYKALTSQKRFNAAFPKYGPRGIVLEKGNGGGSYAHFYPHYGPNKTRGWLISLGANRCEPVLLHEIAHHVAKLHPQYGHDSDHGPGFASALLDVVRIACGAEAERALRHLYRGLRIRVYAPGKPKGVLPRAPGEPPAKAAATIAKVVDGKKAAKTERSMMRALITAMPDQTATGDFPVTCPACSGPATLTVWFSARWGGRGSNGLDYHGRCKAESGCGFSEYHRVAGKAYYALRQKARAA